MSSITINVKDRKIKIVTRARSYMGNFCGWSVFIDGKKYISDQLEELKAIDFVFCKWVKTQPSTN